MRRAALLAVVALAAWAPAAAALPVITPKLFGTAGNNGWYRSNVTVNWTVVDDQGPVRQAARCCDTSRCYQPFQRASARDRGRAAAAGAQAASATTARAYRTTRLRSTPRGEREQRFALASARIRSERAPTASLRAWPASAVVDGALRWARAGAAAPAARRPYAARLGLLAAPLAGRRLAVGRRPARRGAGRGLGGRGRRRCRRGGRRRPDRGRRGRDQSRRSANDGLAVCSRRRRVGARRVRGTR